MRSEREKRKAKLSYGRGRKKRILLAKSDAFEMHEFHKAVLDFINGWLN